jgi:hypothetical protein
MEASGVTYAAELGILSADTKMWKGPKKEEWNLM